MSSTFSAALEARLSDLDLPVLPHQVRQFERYYELLRRWNPRVNLTALALDAVPAPETLDRLFLEPLVAAALLEFEPLTCLDLGSGGGSPAIPLKIARPDLVLTMVEARSRKTAFLREAVRQLELSDTDVLTERFENLLPTYESSADLLSVRAVRLDPEFLSLALRLLEQDGRLLTFGTADPLTGFDVVETVQLGNAGTLVTLYERA